MSSPIPLFPSKPSLKFFNDPKLQGAVDDAFNRLETHRGGKAKFSLVLIDLAGGARSGTLNWGGYKPNEMHYVASSVKVAGMLAAYALRDMVMRFWTKQKIALAAGAVAKTVARVPMVGPMVAGGIQAVLPTASKESPLFRELRLQMDPVIDAASKPLLVIVGRGQRVPQYDAVFDPGKDKPKTFPDFTGNFRNSMRAMIVPSDNGGAGRVIRGVGYGYLNGLMQHFELFDPKKMTGVWLAGDYVGTYPYVRIASDNDGAVAQAGTALASAQMITLILNNAVLDPLACEDMRKLLAAATLGIDQPFLSRDTVQKEFRIPRDQITHAKLGFGPLKVGGNVLSEMFRLENLGKPGRAYAVAFQNVNEKESYLADVAWMIRRTLALYE